jgi:hypothetical protein
MGTAALFLVLAAGAQEAAEGWKTLFNGKDFTGWDVYVGPPGGGKPPRGLNHDPDRVFTVVEIDGAPAVRVSGQTVGGVSTLEEFDNFHFRVEFKWGKLTWPPRKDIARDCGILYYCTGPHGAGSGGWLKSVESNIMEEDYGSFWSVAGPIVDIEVGDKTAGYAESPKGTKYPVYEKGGRLRTFPEFSGGCRPTPIPEPPHGTWNLAEVYSINGSGIHVFNGKVTLVLRNSRHKVGDRILPYRKGRIQLQSEWAEVYYRNMQVRPLKEFPKELREWVEGPGGDDSGFTPLFAADRLKDWAQCGPGSFDVKDGVATGEGGMGMWWYKAKPFRDFVLRGEFLQEAAWSDSGVFLRFPDPGGDPSVGFKRGHEMEIGEPAASKNGTGSFYPYQGPTWLPLKPPGEWNAYEITVIGRTYELRLNGDLVNRFVDTQDRPLEGYIGLQNYPSKAPYVGRVSHRNVRIKELP